MSTQFASSSSFVQTPSTSSFCSGHDEELSSREVPRSQSLDHACTAGDINSNLLASLPLRSASISTLNSTAGGSINAKPARRLSRKLPPAWTESLEDLAQLPPISTELVPSCDHNSIRSKNTNINYHNYSQTGISPMSQTVSLPQISETPQSFIGKGKGKTMVDNYVSRQYILDVAPPLPSKDDINHRSTHHTVTAGPSNINGNVHKATPPLPRSSRLSSTVSASSSTASISPSAATNSMKIDSSKMKLRKAPSSRSEILMTPHLPASKLPFSRSHRSRLSTDSHSSANCSSSSGGSCGTTWSILDEVNMADNMSIRSVKPKKETRAEKKNRVRHEKAVFDEDTPPTAKQLFEASLLDVVDEHGVRMSFGDLIRNRRTIVVFIRHWFCPLCAQYMNSILAEVSPDALEEAGVDLVIIGNGSDKMLNGYRNKAFRCPFKMYTDPTLALYRALGLTRQTGDSGSDEDKGEYLVQTAMESTVQTIKRATKMPLRNPGHFTQLGGEFIFDGTLNVTYTHRMTTTRDHAPIRDICAEAGVRLEFIHYEPGPPPPPVHRRSYLGITGASNMNEKRSSIAHGYELDTWQEDRDSTLERMKALKEARRGGVKVLDGLTSVQDLRSRVPQVEIVRIVGQDLEEDEVVHGFSGLGLAM